MRLLLVKMSSLGDLVHCFPAITDALRARPDIQLDWVVERGFAEIAALHAGVRRIVPIELRTWRRQPLRSRASVTSFVTELRAEWYDLVLDAQGLLKSAVVSRLARAGARAGFDRNSAREPLASRWYGHRHAVPRAMHAVDRQRALFGLALDYAPAADLDFGLRSDLDSPDACARSDAVAPLVFLHGTSWRNKQWPVAFWRDLAERAVASGRSVLLPWGSGEERARSQAIAGAVPGCSVPERTPLSGVVSMLSSAGGVVTVDTGLGHLAVALGVPTVGLYGPTDPSLTGLRGPHALNLASAFGCAPCRARACAYRGNAVHWQRHAIEPACFAELTPDRVWNALVPLLRGHRAGTMGR
jgi:heptosyltransferase I